MKTKYWKVKKQNNMFLCTCPACKEEKLIMHLGRFRIAKCQWCGAALQYRDKDIERFEKGYRGGRG